MKHVYFLKYNNYANRIFKRGLSLSDYLGVDNANFIAEIKECNLWNPNDGITTVLVTPVGVNFSVEPDYLIATDEYGTIDSRWFVTETIRLLRGQYRCHLKRDVFAEAWEELMDATCNIDRALLSRYSKLIFNPEPISVNQIITDELEIKDKTGCPWIVFYGSEIPSSVTTQIGYDYDYTTPSILTFQNSNTFKYLSDNEHDIQLRLHYKLGTAQYWEKDLLPYGLQNASGPVGTYSQHAITGTFDVFGNIPTSFVDHFKTKYTLKGSREAEQTAAMNGKIVYDSTAQKFYRINVLISGTYTQYGNYLSASDADLVADGRLVLSSYSTAQFASGKSADDVVPAAFTAMCVAKQITTTCEEIQNIDTINAKVPASSYIPTDTPYYIWAMPYGNISVTVDNTEITTDKDVNLAVAMSFSTANTSGKLYDFQILPFCPLPNEFVKPDGSIEVNTTASPHLTETDSITKTVDGITSTIGHIFSIPKASFTKQILLGTAISVDDPKLRSITDVWRLDSPNYASSFEFSVAKNNGLTGFNIRCTYMPINPYIRVAPIFGGIYGSYFEENVRGLVCGGDYSMARIASAWVNYQEQNKNFEAIFNRQIDNMDVMRKYQRVEDVAGAFAGVAGGAAAGAMVAGHAGAAVGAIGGVATGAADLVISENKYQEQKSYATDIHRLELGNVQAMPRTLARTTAFNIDNRFFPILTLYRCSSDELSAVVSFIQNRSMTVGIIGKPSSYINNTWSFASIEARGFIKGSIVKIESTHDTHFVDELNAEFQKGVYMR